MAEERGDDEKVRLHDAIATGRDLYRRGAIAVARTAGDNGALVMLAAGTAVAGLSWLVVRRRARRRAP